MGIKSVVLFSQISAVDKEGEILEKGIKQKKTVSMRDRRYVIIHVSEVF